MIISCGFICVFAVLINKVSLQETVEAVIGGSVLLPCSSTEHDLKLQDINVHWRHNGSKIVYDIIEGSHSQEKQDPVFKNRIETFPEEYESGNFSIRLTNLTRTDGGKYICFITHSSEQPTVQLIIKESTAEKGSISTEGETEPEGVETSSPWLWVGIVIVIVIIIIIVIVYFRKRSSSHSWAGGHDMRSGTHEDEDIINQS
ncbi:hypothetical protein PO909_027093 [Leuciscus waleckii]